MEDEKSKKGNILVDAAKALGSVAGKVASIAKTATPAEASPDPAAEPIPPKPTTKSSKKLKLAAKNKSRLPRREKKELKKTQRKAASKG